MGIVYSKEYEQENGTPTVLLLGNGFDLQLGLKSRYEDFLLYLYMLDILQKARNNKNCYEKVKEELKKQEKEYLNMYKNPIINIFDIVEERASDFFYDNNYKSNILTKNVFLSCLFAILKQDCLNDVCVELQKLIFSHVKVTKCDLTDYLENIFFGIESRNSLSTLKNETKDKIKIDFLKFLNLTDKNEHKKINGWLDIESLIECLLTKNSKLIDRFSLSKPFKKYLSDICSHLNLSNNLNYSYIFLKDLNKFTYEFCEFVNFQIALLKRNLNYVNSLKGHLQKEISLYCKVPNAPFIKKIDIFSNIYTVINYNYTCLSELISDFSNITVHVNGKSENYTAIFGTNEDVGLASKFDANQYSSFLYKQTQRDLKHIEVNFGELENLCHEYLNPKLNVKEKKYGFNLIIYGHSCSLADVDLLKTLLTHPNLRVALVLCYDRDSFSSIYDNLKIMLGSKQLSKMMHDAKSRKNRLFFVTRYCENNPKYFSGSNL